MQTAAQTFNKIKIKNRSSEKKETKLTNGVFKGRLPVLKDVWDLIPNYKVQVPQE